MQSCLLNRETAGFRCRAGVALLFAGGEGWVVGG